MVSWTEMFAELFPGCAHRRFARPQGGLQKCLDCGAQRSYTIGAEPGRWHKPWLGETEGAASDFKRRALIFVLGGVLLVAFVVEYLLATLQKLP